MWNMLPLWRIRQRSIILSAVVLCFLDFQGSLFLRHTETGKCIKTSQELVYANPTHAFPYYVVMTDNCLESNALFRYLDNQLLHAINAGGSLVAPSHASYRGRLAVYTGISRSGKHYQRDKKHRLKQTAAGSLFFYNRNDPVCAEPSSKYLLRKTYCDTTKQEFTFGKWNIQMLCPICDIF